MNHRRLVGIDLGIATAHTVRVLDGEGNVVAKRTAWPPAESLTAAETVALAGCPAGTRLEVVIEPTGPAWLPIAVFFSARGHRVFRVSSQKAADLRRFLSRHAKSNGIDADTLARLPLFDPAGLRPLVLPGTERAALDRRVRATDRLTQAGADHKRRIKDLARQLLPMSPLTGDLGAADLAVLGRYADPNALTRLGMTRLTTLITKASHHHQGAERASQWLEAAQASLALYDGHPAVDFAGLAAEVATEVRLLRATQAELAVHAAEREARYQAVDPDGLARSLPGVADVGGPALTACMGDPARFGNGKRFRSFTGLTPKASETGETDRKVWVPKTRPPYAAWNYSWRRPPSRSCRMTSISASTGSGSARSGLACFRDRCGRWVLKWASYSARTIRRCAALMMRIRSRISRRTLPTQRSMIAFARGAWTGVLMIRMPSAWNTVSNPPVNLVSLSRIRNVNWPARSPRSSSRLRACWVTHVAAGWAVTPSTWTLRVACSTTAKQYNRASVIVSAWKKSHAKIPAA